MSFFSVVGETFKSLSFQYRIGATTISSIVKDTCEAIHQVLKDEFLKVVNPHHFHYIKHIHYNIQAKTFF